MGPCPSKESLCCPACPTAPPPPLPFRRFSAPVSKVATRISLYLLCTCMYHTFSHITFLGYNHMHSRASVFLNSLLSEHTSSDDTCVLGGGSFPVTTHGFSFRGVAVKGKEIAPVAHIRGKWLSSRLTSGSKISLTAGFEPCPQGPAPSSIAAAHSPFHCVPCFVHSMPVLAASHSSLALWDHIFRSTLLPWLSGITFFEGPSFLCILTLCISPIEQGALVL